MAHISGATIGSMNGIRGCAKILVVLDCPFPQVLIWQLLWQALPSTVVSEMRLHSYDDKVIMGQADGRVMPEPGRLLREADDCKWWMTACSLVAANTRILCGGAVLGSHDSPMSSRTSQVFD